MKLVPFLAAAAAFAQAPPPNLRGIWLAPAAINVDLEKAKVIVDPPGGEIPYNATAAARRQANAADRAKGDPENKCFQPGVPRATYASRFQIFQNASAVYIVYENVHAYRIIYLDNPKHNDGLPYAMGDSRGHWEGNTLVADVASFSDQTWFDRTGTHHSDALHVVERYTRPDRQTLMYEARIEDPNVFARSWTMRVPLKLDSTALLEDECEADANGVLRHVSPFKAAKLMMPGGAAPWAGTPRPSIRLGVNLRRDGSSMPVPKSDLAGRLSGPHNAKNVRPLIPEHALEFLPEALSADCIQWPRFACAGKPAGSGTVRSTLAKEI